MKTIATTHTSHSVGRATLVLLLAYYLVSPVFSATRIPLVVDEPTADRQVSWPVTTGVPFPRDGLKEAKHCRLVDDQKKEHPLQSRVAATWDAKKKSIRWLTIDFIAQPGRAYFLEFGTEVLRKEFPTPLRITSGESVRLATGNLQAEFSEQAPAALTKVCVDLDGNGRIDDDEIIAAGSKKGEHYYVDQNGQRFTSRDDTKHRRIVIEEDGPVRACVRVDGFYLGPDGGRVVAYRTRYHVFAGLGLVKVVDEFKIVGSTQGTRFADIGFALDLPLKTAGRTVSVDASGEPGNQTLPVPWQSSTQSIASLQSVYRHLGNPEYHAAVVERNLQGEKRHTQTDRMGEWMQVAGRRGAVTGSLRWFWQQFPKEWETTTDQLVLHLWSPRGGELDFSEAGIRRFIGTQGSKYLLDAYKDKPITNPISHYLMNGTNVALQRGDADGRGVNKHHEFFLHFAPAKETAQAQEYAALAAQQPLALATGEWNCGTDVFGPLLARPNDSKYEAIVDRLFELSRYAQDSFGDYGWSLFGAGPHYSYHWDPATKRHYADARRFDFHTYQKETQLWWNYLRSGERKFYDWAIPSENHWVDMAVSHQPRKFKSRWRGGVPKDRTLDWPVGDWLVDGAAHHLRHHQTGEAWLRGGSQFWASYHRTLETTTLAYYLTGDERFNDVVDYWRNYYGDLAGKTSASTDVRPWHRQQAWFQPTGEGEPTKTWAEMMRDYAPFNSGSRHQQTLFFNLATLYEHTWDPRVGQALQEYADAFLDPQHPIGVWRCQDNQSPAKAEAPTMAHFWAPALWKYARVTRDPQMKEIFRRYFNSCYLADPFREDVGIYSNVQIGYAYYFTRDPKHLRPALRELEKLLPNAAPLVNPEELGRRIYNPYAPIASFTAVPRLAWALDHAKTHGVRFPPREPLQPQRTAIAIYKTAGVAVNALLWGFDARPALLGPNGKSAPSVKIATQQHTSHLQPVDRVVPGHAVFTHNLTIPAAAPEGFYVVVPKLETAVLQLTGTDDALFDASQPVLIGAGQKWRFRAAADAKELLLEGSQASVLKVVGPLGEVSHERTPAGLERFPLNSVAGSSYRIENTSKRSVWFRVAHWPAQQCWLTSGSRPLKRIPDQSQTRAALTRPPMVDASASYLPGRFGKAVQVLPDRQLHLPDRLIKGSPTGLLNHKQGTIEFWVKKLWDDRLQPVRSPTLLTNGFVSVTRLGKLPIHRWAHVAVVWRPSKRDPSYTLVHVYIDGLDTSYYRSLWWPGYGNRPIRFSPNSKQLGEFVTRIPKGAAFAIDELRISSVPRYADLDIDFGPQQTLNPVRLTPPKKPFEADEHTLLLWKFDGSLRSSVPKDKDSLEGRLGI